VSDDENSHASRIAEQLRAAEQDEDLPDCHREKARKRREQIEAEQEGDDGE